MRRPKLEGELDQNHALSEGAKEIVSCRAGVPTKWPDG